MAEAPVNGGAAAEAAVEVAPVATPGAEEDAPVEAAPVEAVSAEATPAEATPAEATAAADTSDKIEEGAATPPAEGAKAEEAAPEETRARGRRNKYVSVDASGKEINPEIGLWPALAGALATLVIIIDDEWIWIPGLIYGVSFWAYKQVRNFVYDVCTIDPRIVGCAAASSGLSTLASPVVTAGTEKVLGTAAKGMTTLSRSMFLSPGGVISPLTWGLRMAGFTRMTEAYIKDTDQYEATLWNKACSLFVAGSLAELGSRMVTAPLVKVVDQVRKQPGKSPMSVAAQMVREKGTMALWEGMAPLRVEMPHVGVMLTTWALTREKLAGMYKTQWEEADPFSRAVSRLPADIAAGAIATTAAYTATHGIRLAYEEQREQDVLFGKAGKKQACPLVVNHAKVPLKECLALRVPHTTFIFAAYGFAMSFAAPDHKELGVVGWGDRCEVRETEYGGMIRNDRRHDDSFWSFFGVRWGEVQRYDRYEKRRMEKEKEKEKEGEN
eukprot:TRINITY_DN19656_c3_g1_i1.p1 TRINITY_DN19656_c3_g1~~TRINITY_DN19656_c3_g1_i1.p1  ORF type:complete len:513 (+),score=185.05 TRINITY_DN19656_c3_g1_i1:49-1539(+)